MSQASPGQDEDDDGDGEPQITWVGQQWRMDGYCGRATPPAAQPAPRTHFVRPVAVVKTRPSQRRVVRIGPPREVNAAPAA